MKKPYYLTTAIIYTSGKPHIGNMYEFILADSICRYHRLIGDDVYFQTGTDEHGIKIEEKAKAAGLDCQSYVDGITAEIKRQMSLVDIAYDRFIRTTDKDHELIVQKMFRRLYQQGDIYKGEYEGLYCKPCESFFTESQLKDGKCPDCGGEVQKAKEEAYFFKMSKYQDRLIKHIEENPHFIQPESRKNEMLNNFLRPGLQDLCVSRTSFKWGIPVDFDDKHVVYVWIDALSNYITSLGYDVDGNNGDLFKKYWPADVHLIGKDILRFHTIYWPIMLMALDVELPKQVFGHPWMLVGEGKMSKSKGNAIYADDLVEVFGVDAVRYFCLHEMPFANDGVITYELMIERVNSDLANILGNLVNRSLTMVNKYFDGIVTNTECCELLDQEIELTALVAKQEVDSCMAELKVADAIAAIMELLRRLNKYIDETEPWILGKDTEQAARLNSVLYTLLEGIRYGAVLLQPFMPQTAKKILDQLATSARDYASLESFGNLEADHKITENPEILFARIDQEALLAALLEEKTEKPSKISLEDFQKLDLRVGQVLAAKKHPQADKLLVLQVDLGERRIQIVSGIAAYYQPEELVDKKLVIVTNLQEAKIRGEISQGMLLAGENSETLEVVEVKDLKVGDKIR